MRTTLGGLIAVVLGYALSLGVGNHTAGATQEAAIDLGGTMVLAGFACLVIVGPILWVRGARATKAEEMDLLRQIAAKTPPPA